MDKTYKAKSFWKRPEGVTGALFLGGVLVGASVLISTALPAILGFLATTLGLVITLTVLASIIFMALDSKARTLVGYMYKSAMRYITSWFIQIDPMAILKSYVDDLKANLKKMHRQINQLRKQMHQLKEIVLNNNKDIANNLNLARDAKSKGDQSQLILNTRKAARLKESNGKMEKLLKRMHVLYRVLDKMYQNSGIMVEDIQDQVKVKEQESKALTAGHSAMKSAMNIIKGDKDKKMLFNEAVEAITDDVSNKMGEMEQFMEMSESFMDSIDLQNGVFEEEGMKMLEEWEKKGDSLLLGDMKDELILDAMDDDILDINHTTKKKAEAVHSGNKYDTFFD